MGVLLWLGLGALTAALGGLLLTRWRRLRPWKKCLLLSGTLHLWVVLALSTVSIPTVPLPQGPETLQVTFVEGPDEGQAPLPKPAAQTSSAKATASQEAGQLRPVAPASLMPHSEADPLWIRKALGEPSEQEGQPASSKPPGGETVQQPPEVSALSRAASPVTAATVPQMHEIPETAAPGAATTGLDDRWPRWPAASSPIHVSSGDLLTGASPGSGTAMKTSVETRADLPPSQAPPLRGSSSAADQEAATRPAGIGRLDAPPDSSANPLPHALLSEDASAIHRVPAPYRWRVAPDRLELARRFGASEETEKAVQRALEWLAANQDPDGRWNPRRHGAGHERYESGRDRQGAGSRADTGITGLALLAFSAAGNTHRQGQYVATVEKGLKYLLGTQAADGNLAGPAATYEFMYCHGIATLAVGEIYGLSGDPRLRRPVAAAVAYTVASQDPWGGGWRYRPQEPGDTSQLGWQLMALKSAELAGIPVPQSTWDGAARYLEGVSAGNHGGLATYRPGERVTRTMTAEALVCRLLLGLAPTHPAAREAGDFLLGELPGEGAANRYYWYYATMAMYQLQGSHWDLWNRALQKTLLATQRRDGSLAGSWDPTTRWDGYGGRVYATALAAMCLEAYYRFFPPPVVVPPGGQPLR